MLFPLIVLSIGAIFAGFVFVDFFVGHHQEEFWRGAIYNAPTNHVLHEAHEVAEWVKWSPLIASIIGLFIAVYVY
jgi:NADH-quinone oxidoreductase subunit L